MELNAILQKQVTAHLTAHQLNDPSFKQFINEINRSYVSFQENKEHTEIAFKLSEKVLVKRKETEKDLATTLQLLTTLFSNLNSGIIAEDENRKILFTNQMYCDMFSIPLAPASMVGMDYSDSAEQTKELFKKPISYIAEINKLLHFRAPVLDHVLEMVDGRFFERSYMPIYNDDVFKGTLWKYTDVTEKIKTENELRRSEENYRNMIEHASDIIYKTDHNGLFRFANPVAERITGYKMEELHKMHFSDLINPEYKLRAVKFYLQQVRKKISSTYFEFPIITKKGKEVWIGQSVQYSLLDVNSDDFELVALAIDITAKKTLERQLEASFVKAEEASKAKESFLANMSHEIRTPLNAIIGMIRELRKDDLTATQKAYVENSSVASKHLLSIINNVLDISKIEAGELTLDNEHFTLDQSVNNILSIMSARAEEKGIYIRSEVSPQIHKALLGDQLRVEQILLNLVGNAVKFTNNGGVTIKCELLKETELEQTIQIAVSDTGVGMDEHYLKNIFKKFSQEDKSVSRKYGGTGLGLAITFELMQLMHGNIDVKSEKNVGTTFSVYITFKKGDATHIKGLFKSTEEIDIENVRILLVEDNEINRLVAQNTFKYYNCIVDEAVNGLDALEKVKQNAYDIILMDIQMPEMDGLQATQKIRHELKNATPIVALTANAFKSEIEKCKMAGMNDYITKPFEETALIKLISRYTKKKVPGEPVNKVINISENSLKLYDLKPLKEMSRGDNTFINKMITLFIEQTKLSLNEINSAHVGKDYETICKVAHRLKSSIDNLGISSIKKEIRELEKLSKEPVLLPEIAALILLINSTLSKVLEHLPSEILKAH
ncbi:MAG: response regulator [Bacteroidota bacterium]|nr:response regulator [Bacteroidota bacterium]